MDVTRLNVVTLQYIQIANPYTVYLKLITCMHQSIIPQQKQKNL